MNNNLLAAIMEVSATFPGLRFGRLLGYTLIEPHPLAARESLDDLFYLTDDELAAKLREYAKTYG